MDFRQNSYSQFVQTVFILECFTRRNSGPNGQKQFISTQKFEICQFQRLLAWFSKGFIKTSATIKLVQICGLEMEERYVPSKGMRFSKKKELDCSFDKLRDFLKAFVQASKMPQTILPKTKNETGYTKWKGNILTHSYKDIH